jgi:hypothetical protein
MAGKPVGTAFAEISLDSTKLEQGLKRVNDQLTSGSIKVEDAYKSLGIKSDQVYDMMRDNATAAVDFIKNKTLSSKEEIIRAETAAAAKIKTINEQQFGSSMLSIDNLKKHWLAASVTIAAAGAAVAKAWGYAEVAADYQERINSIDALGKKYGTTGQAIVEGMQIASRGLMSLADTANMAASALNLSLTPTQMIEFTKVSEQLSDVIGGTIPESFNRMVVAAASGRTMTLAQMGIIVDLDQAYKDFAATHGRSTQSLSDAEKQQIRLNVILEAAKGKVSELGPAVDTSRDKMDRWTAGIEDLKLSLGQGIIKAAAGAVGAFQTLASGVLVAVAGFYKLEQASMTVKAWTTFGAAAKIYSDAAKEAGANSAAAMGASEELAGKAASSFAIMTAKTNELTAATKKKVAVHVSDTEAIKDNTDAIKKQAAVSEKASEDRVREAKKAGQDIIDSYYKEQSTARDYYSGLAKQAQTAEEKRASEAKRAGQLIIDSYYDELTKATNFYSNLNVKAKESGDQRVQVEIDVFGQMSAIEKEKLIKASTFFEGVTLGYQDIADEALTFGEAGYNAIRSFAQDSNRAVSDILFNGIKTGSLDAKTVFATFTDSMTRTFTDTVAQMVTEAAADDIILMFNAEWSSGASSVLGIIDKIMGLVGGSSFSLADAEAASTAFDPAIRGYASGGGYEAGKPFWAGEKGPEIIFPSSSGQVLNHEQSMIYAAKNGGHIPGYAAGTGITAMQKIVYDAITGFYSSSSGFGISGAQIDFTMADARIPGYYGMVILPSGEIVDQRQVKGGTFFSDVLEVAAPAIMMAAAAATENYAAASALAAAMISEGQGKGDEAAILNAISAYAGASYAGQGSSSLGSIAGGVAKKIAVNQAMGYILSALVGGEGGAKFSFAGASGDLSWLTSGMASIAPKSSSFNMNPFSARNGLDRVPYDNFPALLHKDERVQTAREARMGGGGSQPLRIEIPLTLNGREIARAVYDESRSGRKTTHRRGLTSV